MEISDATLSKRGAEVEALYNLASVLSTGLERRALAVVLELLEQGVHPESLVDEKNTVEVLADDLGNRTIPSVVAFRGEEIITGEAAVSQMHKNAANTFDDVRSRLLDSEVTSVMVPHLDKDLTVQELTSHFFRNIHNQIKQQVGKAVRECVVTVPTALDEETRKKLVEAAQAGGMRIKACIEDTVAALMAHKQDEASVRPSRTLVVDIGWSRTSLSLFSVSGGLFVPAGSVAVPEAGARNFVNLIAAHCAKDFTRKHKIPCEDNKRSMMRLRRECEIAMRSLSTGAEATIDIDSLCEGVDYSFKLSRARFEDLVTIPFMHMKNGINTLLASAGWTSDAVQQVIMIGGGSSIPRAIANLKAMFPQATFPVGKFETAEVQCIGACLHGKFLYEQALIDNAPTASPVTACLTRSVRLSADSQGEGVEVLPKDCVLPARIQLQASLPAGQTKGYARLLAGPESVADTAIALGEVVFEVAERGEGDELLRLEVAVSEQGEISLEVTQVSNGQVVGGLTVPAAP